MQKKYHATIPGGKISTVEGVLKVQSCPVHSK